MINGDLGFGNSLHITASERLYEKSFSYLRVTFSHAKRQWVKDVNGGQKYSSIQMVMLTGRGVGVKKHYTTQTL
jgi:hypothetical protein